MAQHTFRNYPLELDQTKHLPALIRSYLQNDQALNEYYRFRPDLDGFRKAIETRKLYPVNRKVLVEVLQEQHGSLVESSGSLRNNLQRLLDGKTFTVTTGHQLCLFTGPLYFIYKIVSAIRLAEELRTAFPDYQFVPVYWMASEDHDFAEINHVHLHGKTLDWEAPNGGAVGRMSGAGLEPLLENLSEILGEEVSAKELVTFFREAYLQSKDLAAATRMLVHELFPSEGVVIIDGDDARLKREFLPVVKRELQERATEQLILESKKALEDLGYSTPVVPRNINLFYLTEGSRERLVFEDDQFKVLNTDIAFTPEALEAEIEAHPERFSPNVALRPVYQEMILPNLAYLGGPSEAAYWFELLQSFDHHQAFFPIVMPRNFALVVQAGQQKRLQKLELGHHDLYRNTDELVSEFVKKQAPEPLDLQDEKVRIGALLEEVVSRAQEVDASLKGAAEAEKQRILKSLENLEGKMLKAEKRKQETGVNQIRSVKDRLFPGGTPQERYDNIIPFYLRWGQRFVHELKDHFDPFDPRMNVLVEEPQQSA